MTAVLLVAAIMRIVMLSDIPPGLARDEVRNADIVSFIRQGEHALFFRTGYGHEPLYHYFAVPFQALLGDNVLSIRLPSVFLGLLLVAAAMRWVKRDFGRVTAVVTGLGLAVGWQPVIFSRIGIRPIMEPLFLVGAAWFWQKKPLLAGLFLGLSLYTYTGARVVFAIPVLFGLLQAILWKFEPKTAQSATLRARLQPSLIILTSTLLIYLPLHFTIQADPTLQARVQQLQGPLDALLAGDVQPIIEMSVATAGVFSFAGPPRWTYTLPGLPLFDGVTAVFFYAGLAIAFWRIKLPRYALILAWLMVGLLPSAITTHAPSVIRIIGATPIVYLLPGIFIAFVHEKRQAKHKLSVHYLWLLIPYFLLLTNHTISNSFIAWPAAEETHHKYQTVLQDMGRYWQANPGDDLVVTQSFFEPIEMDTMRRNMGYDVAARWVQTSAEAAGAIVVPNSEDSYLYVPEYAAPHPALLEAAGIVENPMYRSEKRPSFAVYPLQYPPPIPIPITPVSFDNKISLLGYKVSQQTGTQLELFTYWQANASLPSDLAIFVHLLDADGTLIGQHDGLDVAPSTLSPNDIIIQRHLLFLPGDLPENYALQVGLYTRSDNKRLTHPGPLQDRLILTEPKP